MGASQTTHVANDSDCTALVRIATERSKLTSFGASQDITATATPTATGGSKTSMNMTLAWNDFIIEGFERVPPGEFAKTVYESSETPFVSVVLLLNEEDENEVLTICHNKRAENGASYIFDDDNIFSSKYGTIWEPEFECDEPDLGIEDDE